MNANISEENIIADKTVTIQENLQENVEYELGNLIDMVRMKEEPFNKKTIDMYHEMYDKIVKEEELNKKS